MSVWIASSSARGPFGGARSLAGRGILSAAWGRRAAEQDLLLHPSAGLDRILELKSEMGASRIARKELR